MIPVEVWTGQGLHTSGGSDYELAPGHGWDPL